MDPDEQTETRKGMRANLKRMTRLAAHCPANFLHLQLFMQAELARLDRRIEPAMRLYEHAMEVARANEFRRDEAMINEAGGAASDRRGPSQGCRGIFARCLESP